MTKTPIGDRPQRLQAWLEFVAVVAGPIVPWAGGLAAGMKLLVESGKTGARWASDLPPPPEGRGAMSPAAAEQSLEDLVAALERHLSAEVGPEILAEIVGYRTLWRLYPRLHSKWLLSTPTGQPLVPFVGLWHADFRPDAPPLPLRFTPALDRYQPPATTQALGLQVDALTAQKLKNNESQLRIRRAEVAGGELVLEFSVCDYRDYLRTHWAMANLEPGPALALRTALCGVGDLLPLEASRAANCLGVSAVAVFNDELILPLSSRHVISSPEMFVPAASGGASFLPGYWHGDAPSPCQDILREAHEELNLDIRDFREVSIRLLGLARNVLRGGKPEAFYCMHVPMRFPGTRSDEHQPDAALRLPALLSAQNLPLPDFDDRLKEVVGVMTRPSQPGAVMSPFARVALHYYVMFAQGCRRHSEQP
jgi:hypothetical protein